jgi:peptidoglycan hydrolase-like protein with peptidoglycan-binding domain
MKETLIAVCRCIIKAIYPLVKAKRKFVKRVRVAYKKFLRSKKAVNIKNNHTPVTSRIKLKNHGMIQESLPDRPVSEGTIEKRFNPDNKPLWKNRRIIISSCALIVIVIVVLSVTLRGKDDNVYASGGTPAAGSGGTAAMIPQYLSLSAVGGVQGGITVGEKSLLSAPTETPVPSPTPSPTPIPTTAPDIPDLVPGCHDVRMIKIQERLMELDYMDDDEPTDYYGGVTEYSLQLFQRKHNLQVDGLIGPETLAKLFADDAKPYTVNLGDKGWDVKRFQERLKELGYLKSKCNSIFGPDTEKAVKDFQKRNKLTADGSIGEATKEALFSENAKEAAKPKPAATKKPSSSSGSSYVRGGKGSGTFDCSGFVYYCLNSVGYKIGYMTSGGWTGCGLPKITSMDDLQPGDIICFKPHHVGIYIGGGQMIDASSGEGKVLIRTCTSSYWQSHFVCGRRVF